MAAGDDRHKLEIAEKQLALVHSYIPRIDAKVSAIFAIITGELAIATATLGMSYVKEVWIAIPLGIFIVFAVATYWNLYRCAFPHLDDGSNSLVYFNEIAKLGEFEYIEKFNDISVVDLTNDTCSQIWQISGIAAKKFRYLKTATRFAMVSALPWAVLLAASSMVTKKMPGSNNANVIPLISQTD